MVTVPFTDVDLIRVAEKLPTAPRLLVELGQAIRDPNVESDDIVKLLRQDSSLVAQLIRMANSAAYAPAEPVGSLERALACVGFAEAHRLVGVVAMQQLADVPIRHYPLKGSLLRQNALYVAVIMEELAKPAGESPRSCYTVGLLRTIGMLALDRLAGAEPVVPSYPDSGAAAIDEWEQRHWGISNVEVAEKVLLHWKLPHETVSAIRHHYRPAKRHNPIIHLLTLASSSATDRFFGLPGEEAYLTPTPENFVKAGLKPIEFQQACERAQRTFDRLLMAGG